MAEAHLITPRGVRRAILRACPLPLIVGGVALGAGASPGVALVVAIPCLTPGAMLLPELWAESRGRERLTTSQEVRLGIACWALATLALLVLVLQAKFLLARLEGAADPTAAALEIGEPLAIAHMIAFLALPFPGVTLLRLLLLDPPTLSGGPFFGSLVGVWAGMLGVLWLIAPAHDGVPLLLGLGVLSAFGIGLGTPVLTAFTVLADELEEWLWPLEAAP